MKKILIFILLIASVQLIGQETTSDIVAGYPVKTALYQNDFSANITGWTGFNGGVVAWDSAREALRIVNSDGNRSRAAILGSTYAYTEGKTYIVAVKTDLNGNGPANFYTEWDDELQDIEADGWSFIQFSESDGNGDERILISQSVADTMWVEYFAIYELVDDGILLTEGDKNDLESQISTIETNLNDSLTSRITSDELTQQTALMYYNTFAEASDATRLVSTTNATATHDAANLALDVTTTSTADRFYIGAQPTQRYSYQWVYIDIENLSDTIYLSAGQNSTDVRTITADGIYEYMLYFDKLISGILATNRVYITTGKSGVSYQINEFRQYQFPQIKEALWAADQSTAVGQGANAGDNFGLAVGYLADASTSTEYGGAGGPERIAIGEESRAMAWRATAVGGHSYATAVSSTAVGAGAVSMETHGVAIGRGSFLPHPDSTGLGNLEIVLGGANNDNLYMGNAWGHDFPLPLSGISVGNYTTPSTIEKIVHGQDAFDFDPDDGTDENVDGGDVALMAGRATGSGVSGSINFYVADGNNGSNAKDTAKNAMEIRSEEGATTDTYVYIRDNATGTLRKVLVKDKPAQSGTGKIIGFSRLQLN